MLTKVFHTYFLLCSWYVPLCICSYGTMSNTNLQRNKLSPYQCGNKNFPRNEWMFLLWFVFCCCCCFFFMPLSFLLTCNSQTPGKIKMGTWIHWLAIWVPHPPAPSGAGTHLEDQKETSTVQVFCLPTWLKKKKKPNTAPWISISCRHLNYIPLHAWGRVSTSNNFI